MHKIGTNAASDRYAVQHMVKSTFRDLALFIIHTGFADIRRSSLPRPGEYVFRSLEIAWRLVEQGYHPAFVLGHNYFTITPTDDMLRTLLLHDVLHSPFDTAFRPEAHPVSVDSLLYTIHARNPLVSACRVHRAMFIVLPRVRISRTTISYRMRKVKDKTIYPRGSESRYLLE
jgi:hypothetical protein